MAHDYRHRTPLRLALVATVALACHNALAQQAPEPPAPPAQPETPTAPDVAVEIHVQSRAEAAEAYAEALRAAAEEQRAALEAVEMAQRELQVRAEEERKRAIEARERAAEMNMQAQEDRRRHTREREELRALERAEREKLREVQRELERAHDNLRRASREVAQVHRSLNRNRVYPAQAPSFGGNRAVIGVILGDNTTEGVQVLGISPDGPAERAGLEQGDVIVSMMGEPLVVAGGDGDGRVVIGEVMEAVEPGDELALVVDRDGERVEYVITAEERTPFSWHTVTRLGAPNPPSAPGAPSAPTPPVEIHTFAFPDIDPGQLSEELEELRGELAERRIIIEREFEEAGDVYYEFETLSEVGDAAIAGTSIWFGMPLTRGLELAEMDSSLGAYFATEDGVLVLRARDDNVLQLQSGDVILSVDGDRVDNPADVMRALRRADAGETIELEIMRRQAAETLTIDIPENQFGMLFDGADRDLGTFIWNEDGGLTLKGQFHGLLAPGAGTDD